MTGFVVHVDLTLSAPGFDIDRFGSLKDHAIAAWRDGDVVSTKREIAHQDSGIKLKLLDSCPQYEWLDIAEPSLKRICAEILESHADILDEIVPHISIFIETDGYSFPPLYISASVLKVLESIGSELDIDIMKTLGCSDKDA